MMVVAPLTCSTPPELTVTLPPTAAVPPVVAPPPISNRPSTSNVEPSMVTVPAAPMPTSKLPTMLYAPSLASSVPAASTPTFTLAWLRSVPTTCEPLFSSSSPAPPSPMLTTLVALSSPPVPSCRMPPATRVSPSWLLAPVRFQVPAPSLWTFSTSAPVLEITPLNSPLPAPWR